MRITVVGVLIVIGAIVVLVLVADGVAKRNGNRGTDNDQPNRGS